MPNGKKGNKLMKKLNHFVYFDYSAFLKGKTLIYVDGKRDDKQNCLKITLLIQEDKTDYGEDGVDNQYEKLVIKMPETKESYLEQFKRNDRVNIIEVKSAKVWGDYNTNLSIIAKVVKTNAQGH